MITTIVGKNSYACRAKLNELKEAFVAKHGENAITQITGDDIRFADLLQQVSAQGLFASANLVILTDFAKNKTLQEDLAEKIDIIPSESDLIIYDPSMDKRTVFFKTLKKKTEVFDYGELDDASLVRWVREEYKAMGGEIGTSEANFLVQRVMGDQWMLKNELEKLITLPQPITTKTIEEVTQESFNETIFQLLDAAFGKQQERAFKILAGLRENKVEPQFILSMIIWQVLILLIVAYAQDRSAETIAKDHKLSPFVVRKSQGLMRKIRLSELLEIVELTATADIGMKTSAGEPESLLDLLVAKIST